MAEQWFIDITAPFGGFAPAYWENTYASFGNKNMARAMTNIDMTDPTGLKQGPALTNLTNGNESGVVTTLIKHILNEPPSADVTYGVGGAKLYKITPTAVTSDGTWPHTINKAAVTSEDGESVFVINGAAYYLYNHSGSAGDIGKYDLASTFDDDWGSTVPTGAAALANAPHPSVIGNDDVAYYGNGRYAGYYDPDTNTLDTQGLDLPVGCEVVDVDYKDSVVWVAVNLPNIAGSNNSKAIIYTWKGVGVSSWEDFPNPRINGKIGALHNFKGSTIFVWYQEVGFTGGYKLGYISGNEIVEVASYSGTLPNFAQTFEYKGQLAWQSDGLMHLWGASSALVPVIHHQHADLGYSTVGAVAIPFGTVIAASNQSTNYRLAKFSGYDVASAWKSLMYQVGHSKINRVMVDFAPTASGARVDLTLRGDQGLSSKLLQVRGQTGSVTHTNDSGKCVKVFDPEFEVNSEVSIEADFANGSAANALLIRRLRIWGQTLEKR